MKRSPFSTSKSWFINILVYLIYDRNTNVATSLDLFLCTEALADHARKVYWEHRIMFRNEIILFIQAAQQRNTQENPILISSCTSYERNRRESLLLPIWFKCTCVFNKLDLCQLFIGIYFLYRKPCCSRHFVAKIKLIWSDEQAVDISQPASIASNCS